MKCVTCHWEIWIFGWLANRLRWTPLFLWQQYTTECCQRWTRYLHGPCLSFITSLKCLFEHSNYHENVVTCHREHFLYRLQFHAILKSPSQILSILIDYLVILLTNIVRSTCHPVWMYKIENEHTGIVALTFRLTEITFKRPPAHPFSAILSYVWNWLNTHVVLCCSLTTPYIKDRKDVALFS